MKLAPLLTLLVLQAAQSGERSPLQQLRYVRAVAVPSGSGEACAVLDATLFPHAAPSLKDLRLYADSPAPSEVPYVITLSEPLDDETVPAHVVNVNTLRSRRGTTVAFDLEMPSRPYTNVDLDIDGRDFLAVAKVTGTDSVDPYAKSTALGSYTLFDLSSQHLSRNATLALQESSLHFLHVVLTVQPAQGLKSPPAITVRGATVPPSREAQTVYTTVASVSTPTAGALVRAGTTRFDLSLPLRVPVERVSFDLAPGFSGNFSRVVTISASPDASADSEANAAASLPLETVSGTISRTHLVQDGHRLDQQQLSVPATLGSNLQSAAHAWIEIENGDAPLPIAAVRLEMRQRKLCFNVPERPSRLTLYYGNADLPAPAYAIAQSARPLAAALGPEQLNPEYRPLPPDAISLSKRHPEIFWVSLVAAIALLGSIAMKARQKPRD